MTKEQYERMPKTGWLKVSGSITSYSVLFEFWEKEASIHSYQGLIAIENRGMGFVWNFHHGYNTWSVIESSSYKAYTYDELKAIIKEPKKKTPDTSVYDVGNLPNGRPVKWDVYLGRFITIHPEFGVEVLGNDLMKTSLTKKNQLTIVRSALQFSEKVSGITEYDFDYRIRVEEKRNNLKRLENDLQRSIDSEYPVNHVVVSESKATGSNPIVMTTSNYYVLKDMNAYTISTHAHAGKCYMDENGNYKLVRHELKDVNYGETLKPNWNGTSEYGAVTAQLKFAETEEEDTIPDNDITVNEAYVGNGISKDDKGYYHLSLGSSVSNVETLIGKLNPLLLSLNTEVFKFRRYSRLYEKSKDDKIMKNRDVCRKNIKYEEGKIRALLGFTDIDDVKDRDPSTVYGSLDRLVNEARVAYNVWKAFKSDKGTLDRAIGITLEKDWQEKLRRFQKYFDYADGYGMGIPHYIRDFYAEHDHKRKILPTNMDKLVDKNLVKELQDYDPDIDIFIHSADAEYESPPAVNKLRTHLLDVKMRNDPKTLLGRGKPYEKFRWNLNPVGSAGKVWPNESIRIFEETGYMPFSASYPMTPDQALKVENNSVEILKVKKRV